MTNTFVYYLVILIPLLLIVWAIKTMENNYWAIGIILYATVYRFFTDWLRLKTKGVDDDFQAWKLLIPLYRIKYFKKLYF